MASTAVSHSSPLAKLRSTALIFVGLAGGTCGITLLYLGMRSVMDIGGACASGGPFVPVQPCPEGVPAVMIGGIWGGIICLGIYAWQAFKYHIPSFLGLAWPALFLSLGWNFLDFGLDPPGGGGPEWGWLVCAIVFGIMGGVPLLFALKMMFNRFTNPSPSPEPVRPIAATELRARLAGAMKSKVAREAAAAAPSTTSPASPHAESMVDALERLQYLHRSGSLTDEEFAAAKARTIEGAE